MNLLLDTHTLIWFLTNDGQLPNQAKHHIQNINNTCYVSIASLWEITIKLSLSKLQMTLTIPELFNELYTNQFTILHIQESHLLTLSELQFHHRDPFDRILIAQAITEKMKLISKDQSFTYYDVELSWE